jgi:hypothetical protein
MEEQKPCKDQTIRVEARDTVSAPRDLTLPSDASRSKSRRRFLGNVRGVAMAAATMGTIALEPLLGSKHSVASAADADGRLQGSERAEQAAEIRIAAAKAERRVPTPPHTTNGDEERYADKCGTYTKALLQDGPGRVNLNAYQSFKTALNSRNPEDFEDIIMGGGRQLVDPQAGLTFDMEGCDSQKFGSAPAPLSQETVVVVPSAPALASAAYGTELIELYWASLLRDVPFTQYPSNPVAAQAAKELSGLPGYAGPRSGGQVTPDLLFRGAFPGETVGPYISQFFITPTFLGQQPVSQQLVTYQPNIDYLTDPSSWAVIQNGGSTGLQNQHDPQLRFAHDGRDLSAWTHIDMLYQGYFVAFLVLDTIGAPANPGSPYSKSKTQVGFGTFGAPHIAGMLGEVAYRALERSWFQKWFVHRRHRPESGGGIVHLIRTGQGSSIDGSLNKNVLNSEAVESSFKKYGSYLLSQAFPEGSPTHPSYPTGHGVVAGACITILKFFLDGNFVIQNPLVPTEDGLSLVPYTGSDKNQITVNGELNKLAHNVSFGHGIHAGIHWRSDTDVSMVLGEATAISCLQDQAQTFNEKFTVHFTKLDGTTATISNQSSREAGGNHHGQESQEREQG